MSRKILIIISALFCFSGLFADQQPAYNYSQPANTSSYYSTPTTSTSAQYYRTVTGLANNQYKYTASYPVSQSAAPAVTSTAQSRYTSAYSTQSAKTAPDVFVPLHLTITAEQKADLRSQYMFKGDQYFKSYYYAQALRYYYVAVQIEPDYVRGWKQVAFCYYLLKKHNYAYIAFKKVLSYDPDDKDAKEFMDFYAEWINKSQKKPPVKREMFDSVWRSMVLPGWGEMNNNQVLKGLLFGSGFILSLGLTIYNVMDERSKYAVYQQANENIDIAYNSAQDAYNTALVFGIATALVWIGSMVDAGLNYNCEEARNNTWDIMYNNKTFLFCDTVRF